MTEREKPPSFESQEPEISSPGYGAVMRAIKALTAADLARLDGYGTFRIATIRGVVFSADPRDLLQEAIVRTLDGRRNWDEERISFVTHLIGCMNSIANEMAKRAHLEQRAFQDSARDERKDKADDSSSLRILHKMRDRLGDDRTALGVYEKLLDGSSRAEICQSLRIPAKVYDAARKRISRSLYALANELRITKLTKDKGLGGHHA